MSETKMIKYLVLKMLNQPKMNKQWRMMILLANGYKRKKENDYHLSILFAECAYAMN